MSSMRREVLQIKQRLEREFGCNVRTTGSGHYWVTRPGYRSITMAASPADGRAIRNIRADLKRFLGVTL